MQRRYSAYSSPIQADCDHTKDIERQNYASETVIRRQSYLGLPIFEDALPLPEDDLTVLGDDPLTYQITDCQSANERAAFLAYINQPVKAIVPQSAIEIDYTSGEPVTDFNMLFLEAYELLASARSILGTWGVREWLKLIDGYEGLIEPSASQGLPEGHMALVEARASRGE
jgi:hypothetical protein